MSEEDSTIEYMSRTLDKRARFSYKRKLSSRDENSDQCDYVATRRRHLKQHKESKHEGVRYPCDECEYVANRAGHLKRHQESKHEGVRYPCDECEYVATQAGDLKRRKESKHEGVRYP